MDWGIGSGFLPGDTPDPADWANVIAFLNLCTGGRYLSLYPPLCHTHPISAGPSLRSPGSEQRGAQGTAANCWRSTRVQSGTRTGNIAVIASRCPFALPTLPAHS